MRLNVQQSIRVLVNCVLVTVFCAPATLLAQSHVASPSDIHKELLNATQTRQQNQESVKQLLSSEMGQKALKSAKIDPEQVTAAVSTLSDTELAQLASRAEKVRDDFAAGRISDRDLLIILVGIAALILIIVAVR